MLKKTALSLFGLVVMLICFNPPQAHAGVVIARGVKIGARCHIGCHAVLGPGVVVGDDCVIGANTTISHALLGDRVRVESCVTIGSQALRRPLA